MTSLLPPTPETTAHVLAQGGALPMPAFEPHRDRPWTDGKEPAQASTESTIEDGTSPATAIDITSPRSREIDPSSSTHDRGLSSYKASTTLPSGFHPHAKHSSALDTPQRTALRSSLETDPRFMSLLSETQAYFTGPNFAYALTCALDRATGVLIDGLRARVFVDSGSAVNASEGDASELRDRDRQERSDAVNADTEVPKEEMKIRLVGLLPGLARWSQLALNSTPNELVDVRHHIYVTLTYLDIP